MNRHLDEAEIAAAVAGLELAPAVRDHLEACLHCRRRVEGTLELIAGRREAMAAEAPDWETQREAILASLGAPPPRRGRWARPLVAAAAAAALAAGLAAVVPRPRPPERASLPVERILAEVDRTLARDTVPGLEPIEDLVPAPDELAAVLEEGAS